MRELAEHLRRFGATGSQQITLEQEAMDHIRLAPNREQAFVEVRTGIDMVLERSRGLGAVTTKMCATGTHLAEEIGVNFSGTNKSKLRHADDNK